MVNNLTGNTLVISTDEFAVTFFGINLGGFEVILGIEFLRTLGPILWGAMAATSSQPLLDSLLLQLAASAGLRGAPVFPAPGAGHGTAHHPPGYYKLNFPTYDGAANPLKWLNHCEQFFHVQRIPSSDRTWLASYIPSN